MVSRRVSTVLGLPLYGLAWVLHRRMVGPAGVLHVVVEPLGALRARAAWLARLRRVALDPAIVTVVLEVRGAPGGFATCEDLRRVLADLRDAGTRLVAWVEAPSNATLWIASACDTVVLPPLAEVELTGLGSDGTYLRGLLDRVGLEADVEAAGAYKSFGEPFRRTHASPEAREALSALLTGLQDAIVRDVARGRGVDEARVLRWIDEAPLGADEALSAGAIDAVAYLDVLLDAEVAEAGDRGRKVAWRAWSVLDAVRERLSTWSATRRIAVVHLEGSIVVDAEGGGERICARRTVPVLDALRGDPSVAAVVVHVDSPGGSAYASDLIWRAVGRLAADKPVVASFADVSASGGYYLASPCRTILARPTTITGSIGVFGGKLVWAEARRKLGVRSQPVSLGRSALRLSPQRPFDRHERIKLRASLQRIYDAFVDRAAGGRGIDRETFEPHCRGRVWTGVDALDRRLVDETGDLFDAVDRAAQLAELPAAGFLRVDLTPPPTTSILHLVVEAVRRRLGGAQIDLPVSLQRWLGPLSEAPGQPLAMLDHPELWVTLR